MADNITLPVATKEVGGFHIQKVTLTDSAGDAVEAATDYISVRLTDGTSFYGAGGGTQFAEDSAHTSGDMGTMALAVRRDTGSSLAGTDGDYAPLQLDSSGNLRVTIASGVGTTQYAEDASHVSGDTGTLALAVRRDTVASSAGADGDYATLNLSSTGRLWCSATIDAALPAGTNAIGKLAANSGVTIGAVEIAASQTLATVTNVSQFGGQAIAMGTGTRSAGTQRVTIATDDVVPCSQSGTWNVATVTTVTTVSTLTGGGVAHDGVDSGNPIKIGSRAIAALSGGTAVAAADRSDVLSDLDGAVIVREDCPFGDQVSGNATNTDGTSTQCIAAQGSGVKTVLTDITIANSSATDITVDVKDGTTVKWTFPVPKGGGVVFSWKRPLVGTANTAWNFDPSAAATTVTCSMSGYKTKV